MGKPEGRVEDYLIKMSVRYDCLHYKFVSPSNNGMPDRQVIGYSHTWYVETKAPGEVPRPLQEAQFRTMRAHGAQVFVLDTKPKIDRFFETVVSPARELAYRAVGLTPPPLNTATPSREPKEIKRS